MKFFKDEFNIIQVVKICFLIVFTFVTVKTYFILTKLLVIAQNYK